jgi:SAM-dependent methyltransferase
MINIRISNEVFRFLETIGAKYRQRGNGIITFKNADEETVLEYLGTYFLRSKIVSYLVFNNLLENTNYIEMIKNKKEIKVLDLGCGVAPEIFGMLKAFINKKFNYENFKFYLLDSNPIMKKYFFKYKYYFDIKNNFCTNSTYLLYDFTSKEKFSNGLKNLMESLKEKFDVILNFNMINEFYRTGNKEENYRIFVEEMVKYLNKDGLIFLTDVCDKNNDGRFFPIIMNQELKKFYRNNKNYTTLLPVQCNLNHNNCVKNNVDCFTQINFQIIRDFGFGSMVYDNFKTNYKIILENETASKLINKKVSNNSKYLAAETSTGFNVCENGKIEKCMELTKNTREGFFWSKYV